MLCVASSSIAAILLPGGRTTHSRFWILIDLYEDLICLVSLNLSLGKLLRETVLII